ncbi:MAG: hypothetical protein WBY53_14195 [Acidobacteriaceae bacterium]
MRLGWLACVVAVGAALGSAPAWGQVDAIPSAQVAGVHDAGRGRELLEAMVKALGGRAWLNRETWVFRGRTTTFYKGEPEGGALQFEEYGRMQPFAERVVTIGHYGPVIAKDHADVADVWVGDRGYEVTYKGTVALPEKKVEDFLRWRRHSVDAVVAWLREPEVLVTYAGTKMVERRLVDEVRVIGAGDDAVTLELDQGTHLPVRLSFPWRDPAYKDWNTDVEELENYHAVRGVMTPFAVTRTHNGDVVSERFLTDAEYGAALAADMFDPQRRLGGGRR